MTMLEKEMQTFHENLSSLLGTSRGKYVLIHKDKIGGIFFSREDAVYSGYKDFGITPFLVKQIQEYEEPINFTSNLIICEKEHNNAIVHNTHN
jgi:hypothetical protein